MAKKMNGKGGEDALRNLFNLDALEVSEQIPLEQEMEEGDWEEMEEEEEAVETVESVAKDNKE